MCNKVKTNRNLTLEISFDSVLFSCVLDTGVSTTSFFSAAGFLPGLLGFLDCCVRAGDDLRAGDRDLLLPGDLDLERDLDLVK